ncbi:histidine kinase [Streptomyces sp. NPDC012888]|uniref:histidine kinase n=1 Tax=Streptomyces sp. NPDC012888 TaxID=3364855 RepID=UPI00369B58F0
MPSYDLSRGRFRLSDEHMMVLIAEAAGQPAPAELLQAREQLRTCGLITEEGLLAHVLQPVLETVMEPSVVVSLETAGRQGNLHHGLFIGREGAVSHHAWPDTDESEYAMVEPRTAVFVLADLVNLQQSRPVEGAGGVVETRLGTVEAGVNALVGVPFAELVDNERAYIRKALDGADATLGDEQAALLTELIAEVRASWRMTAAWQAHEDGQDGVAGRGIAVWDCGPLGYWHRELPEEPVGEGDIGPDTPTRLVRIPAKRVWELIAGLLPEEHELRGA